MTIAVEGIDVLQRPAATKAETLSAFDDLPLHSTAAVLSAITPPLANWAERYYFNVLRPSGEIVAILGAGIYPDRGIAECYFCRLEGETQHNIRVCQALPAVSGQCPPAPVSLRCRQPMRSWDATIAVDGNRFDGRFVATTAPYHYSTVAIPATETGGPCDDYQHVVSAGCWDVNILQGSEPGTDYHCIRDRTWGTRTRRLRLHNWMVFDVAGACITVMHQERSDGSVMYSEGGVAWPDGRIERMQVESYDFRFDSHTREARSGCFDLAGAAGKLRLEYQTVGFGIRLNGAGYDDAQGGRTAGQQVDRFDLGDADEARRSGRGTIDIGAHARVAGILNGEGMGVVESAVARDHARFGSAID